MLDFIKNNTIFLNKYRTDSEAVIISCFFNPQKSPYRTKAFKKFYEDIKHLNHLIIECVIGDGKPELELSDNIKAIRSDSHLWHKEGLLNYAISRLPEKYKYVFWVDADVIFTNKNWLVDGVDKLKSGYNMIQPFEFCVHLDKDELEPSFDLKNVTSQMYPNARNSKVWRSFSATFEKYPALAKSTEYNTYGHVGFAWGAKIEVLKQCALFDRALIGGADHVMALGATGQFNHLSMQKSFTENLDEVDRYQQKLFKATNGVIGFVEGNLYHIWHGDIEKRQYLKRIQDFTPTTKQIHQKDRNGLYVAPAGKDKYVREYFDKREVKQQDDSFLESAVIAYVTNSTILGTALGGNVMGAMVGDMLNNTDSNKEFEGFGGGDFGGVGAEGSYDEPVKSESVESVQDLSLGNFS
jgi:hypothetical protein